MTWNLRINGSTLVGGSVLPGLTAQRGGTVGRLGIVPRAGRLSAVLDRELIVIGNSVELLDDNAVVWTGRARELRQSLDAELNVLRWRLSASGPIADFVAIESGAETQWFHNITIAAALQELLTAIGWPDAKRSIGSGTTRTLSHWRLSASDHPWEAVRQLMRTAGPDSRIDETAAGLIAFRFAAPPASTRTLYGRQSGSGARALVSRLTNEEAGLDRVLNRVSIPTAITPGAGTPRIERVEWGVSAPDAPDAFARLARDRLALAPGETALVVTAAAAYVGAPAQIPAPTAPDLAVLNAQTWESVHGAGAVARMRDVTVNTPDSTVEALTGRPASTQLWEVTARGATQRESATGTAWVRDQSGGGTADVGIPPGSRDVSAELTALRGWEAELEYDSANLLAPIGGVGGQQQTIAPADAGDHVRIEISGPRLNVQPRTPEARQVFRNAADAAGSVWAYDATVRVRWTEIDAPRTWASLAAGIAQTEGSDYIEVATRVGDVANAVERASAAVAALVLSGGSPRVIAPGAVVDAGTLLLSLAVVESALNADARVTLPEGWAPVTGAPLANVEDAPRRVLWGAWRRMAARGAVAVPSWAVTGPMNAAVRTMLVAVDPQRAVVWRDSEGERVLTSGAAVTIDVRLDTPVVDITSPVPGLDFAVRKGAIASIAISTAHPGVTARITLTAGSAGATVADLRLRGVAVVAGADQIAQDAASITAQGRSGRRLNTAPWLSAAEGLALAAAFVRRRSSPSPGWTVELDAARSALTRMAALGMELGEVVRVALDSQLDRTGEVVSIEHRIHTAASILGTNVQMLGIPPEGAVAPSAPRGLQAVAQSTTEVLVTWGAPLVAGTAALTGYRLEWRQGTSGNWTQVALEDVVRHTLSGLTPATLYQVRVAAVSSVGASVYVGPVSVTTSATVAATAPPTPAAPMLALSMSFPYTAIVASWPVLMDGGSVLTRTSIRIRQTGTSAWTTANIATPAVRMRTFQGLTQGTEYEAQLQATNGIGTSAWSPSATLTTQTATAPSMPANARASAGPTSPQTTVVFAWDASSANGSPITGYRVEYKLPSANWFDGATPVMTTGLTVTVSTLSPVTTYNFRVRAMNAIGASAWSSVETITTTAPGQLPVANAPAVVLSAVADGNEGTSVTLGATLTGGLYDAVEYAWTATGGTFDDAAVAAPTWMRPSVNADTVVTISLTVTVRGTGEDARSGTSDTETDTETTTVENVPTPVSTAITFSIEGIPLEVEGIPLTRGTTA